MALITTPSANNADSYADVTYFKGFADKYGYTLGDATDAAIEQALRRGTRWIDGTYQKRFIGIPTQPDQSLEWPRSNVIWRGYTINSATIPAKIKNAACEAAMREITTPNSLSPDYIPSQVIKQEQVGDLSVTYQDVEGTIADVTPIVQVVDLLIQPFLKKTRTDEKSQMSIVTLKHIKEQLNFTDDIGNIDDDLLMLKIKAAQNHTEQLLGYKIEDRFGGEGQEPIPPALIEAISELAAWWYEQREAVGGANSPLALGFNDIIREYREWTF